MVQFWKLNEIDVSNSLGLNIIQLIDDDILFYLCEMINNSFPFTFSSCKECFPFHHMSVVTDEFAHIEVSQ